MTIFEILGTFYVILAVIAFTFAWGYFAWVGIQETRRRIRQSEVPAR